MPLQAELADLRPAKEFTTHRQPSTDSRQLTAANSDWLQPHSTERKTLQRTPQHWPVGPPQVTRYLRGRGPSDKLRHHTAHFSPDLDRKSEEDPVGFW